MKNARELVVKILYKIEYEGAYLNIALKDELAKCELSKKDKALVTRLVYGICQRDIELEYIISCYSKIKLKKISKFILLILKLGIYQIMYMDKIPDSAAVDESVKLSYRFGAGKSKGFINGILRCVAREKAYPVPNDKIKAISVKYSFPEWICKKWVKEFGYDIATSIMESLNEDAPTNLRVNTLLATRQKVLELIPGARENEFLQNAVEVSGFDVVGSDEYKKGYITLQDTSAMLSVEVLSPKENEIVEDVCAAPGGKTTYAAQLMNNKGKVFAFDIHPHKIELINQNASRLGIEIIDAKVNDATVYNEDLCEKFDKVLADVPCSGLGIIRTKPDIKKKEYADLFDVQYKILQNSSKYLKNGGEIVYSTCTISKEENEDVVEKFLKENPEFQRVDINEFLPEKLRCESAKKGYITIYPNQYNLDGFFIAKLKRCENK